MRSSLFLNHFGLCCLVLGAAGCAADDSEPQPISPLEAKAQALESWRRGEGPADPCADNGWYSDGECDTFCVDTDTDCAPSGDPVVCLLFIESSDGVCSRPLDDACRFQDPDCGVQSVPTNPPDPDEPIACALISEVPDGVCRRPDSDPCRFQDPDCIESGGSDLDEGAVCALFIEESDGVCSRPANDPCKAQDPDCTDPGDGVVCAQFIESPDGMCSRPKDDPCIFQDPDCRRRGRRGARFNDFGRPPGMRRRSGGVRSRRAALLRTPRTRA